MLAIAPLAIPHSAAAGQLDAVDVAGVRIVGQECVYGAGRDFLAAAEGRIRRRQSGQRVQARFEEPLHGVAEMQRALPGALCPAQARGQGSGAWAAQVQRGLQGGDAAFDRGQFGAADAGGFAGHENARLARAHLLIMHDGPAAFGRLPLHGATGLAGQLGGGQQAIADNQRVGLERSFAARHGFPRRRDAAQRDALHLLLSLGARDQRAEAYRHALAPQVQQRAGGLFQRREMSGQGAPVRQHVGESWRRAGEGDFGHLRAGLEQQIGHQQQQGMRAGQDEALAGTQELTLHQVWTPPADITPGSVQPGKATGRS